jgi:hypothetical protein
MEPIVGTEVLQKLSRPTQGLLSPTESGRDFRLHAGCLQQYKNHREDDQERVRQNVLQAIQDRRRQSHRPPGVDHVAEIFYRSVTAEKLPD